MSASDDIATPPDAPFARDPVVETFVCKLRDALDVARGKVGAQLDDDIAAARKGQGKGVRVGHRLVSIWECRGAM